MDSIQFAVQLQDAVSSPAKNAAAALAKVGKAAEDANAKNRAAAEKMRGIGKVLEFAGVPFAGKLNQGAEIMEKMGPHGMQAAAAVGAIATTAVAVAAGVAIAAASFVALSVAIFQAADKGKTIGKSWDNLKAKAAGIFSRVNVAPIAAALDRMAGLFSANTASGEAMAHVVGKVWSAVAELTGKLIDLGRPFFEGLIIGALQLYVAFLEVRNSDFGRWVASLAADMFPATSTMTMLGKAAVILAGVLTGTLGVALTLAAASAAMLALPLGVLAVAALAMAAPFVAIGAAIYWVVGAISDFVDSFSQVEEVPDMLGGMVDESTSVLGDLVGAAVGVAGDFVAGLANGITAGVGRVVDAARALGASAASAVKAALGIASPSRVMLAYGGFTAEGFAGGMEQGIPDVQASARQLAAAPISAAAVPALPAAQVLSQQRSGAGSAGGATVSVGNVTITIHGVAGADQLLERLPTALADAFEVVAESMGVGAYA